jgi:hypothetical protein
LGLSAAVNEAPVETAEETAMATAVGGRTK